MNGVKNLCDQIIKAALEDAPHFAFWEVALMTDALLARLDDPCWGENKRRVRVACGLEP